MLKSELKRTCCVCGSVTYHSDTYGTWISGAFARAAKKEYKNKWVEYRCIDKARAENKRLLTNKNNSPKDLTN